MDGAAVQPPGRSTPLNLFQRLVLQWEQLHPYNAAQILKIAGPPDVQALTAAWQEALAALGLGRVHLTGSRLRHETLNGELQRYPVQTLDESQSLCDVISAGLNRAFDDANEPPFRPFILKQAGHHYAGIVYHHWVADSVSIRLLLREWFLRVHQPDRVRRRPLKHPRGYWSLFGPARSNWDLTGGVLTSLRWTYRNRGAARIDDSGFGDFNCRFLLHEVGDGLIAPLLALARRNNATLNDLFLAITAQVCNHYVPLRRTARRKELALGTIVDLRPYCSADLSDTFGLFLGFTSTLCKPRELKDFPRLLRSIAAQSALQKRNGMPLSSPVRMAVAYACGKFYDRDRIVEFYRKRVPLAGGISNINLNRTWAAKFHPHPLLDYIRVSPTGPMMPLVFTPTTLGDHLHLGFTYRPSIIPPQRAAEMANQFAERLRALASA